MLDCLFIRLFKTNVVLLDWTLMFIYEYNYLAYYRVEIFNVHLSSTNVNNLVNMFNLFRLDVRVNKTFWIYKPLITAFVISIKIFIYGSNMRVDLNLS